MASIDKQCDIANAFNFSRDFQGKIGHLVSLKIGDTAVTADLALKKPTDESEVKVVGVISSISWGGGAAEPITSNFNVSVNNKNALATLIHTQLKSIAIEWNFNIYEYDKEAKLYFLSFHCNETAVKGLFYTRGAERVFYVSDEPGMEVQKPENFPITIGTVPEDEKQDLHVAISNTMKFVKQWGVTRA